MVFELLPVERHAKLSRFVGQVPELDHRMELEHGIVEQQLVPGQQSINEIINDFIRIH